MECFIEEHHLSQPPTNSPMVALYLNRTTWPKSVQDRFNKFCLSKSINRLNIYSHHVALHSSLRHRGLPQLMSKKNSKQGKFTFSFRLRFNLHLQHLFSISSVRHKGLLSNGASLHRNTGSQLSTEPLFRYCSTHSCKYESTKTLYILIKENSIVFISF